MEEQKNISVNAGSRKVIENLEAYHKMIRDGQQACINECRSLGFAINELDELYQYKSIKILIPILLKHIKDMQNLSLSREWIARALEKATRDDLTPYFNELLQMYEAEPAHDDPNIGGVRWVIGCLLAKAVKGKAAFEKIEALLFDKSYGSDRMSLLGCVRRMPKEQKARVKEKIRQDQLLRENINRR